MHSRMVHGIRDDLPNKNQMSGADQQHTSERTRKAVPSRPAANHYTCTSSCRLVKQKKPILAGRRGPSGWIRTIIYQISPIALEHIRCALSLSWSARVQRPKNCKKVRERPALKVERVCGAAAAAAAAILSVLLSSILMLSLPWRGQVKWHVPAVILFYHI